MNYKLKKNEEADNYLTKSLALRKQIYGEEMHPEISHCYAFQG